MQLPAGRYWEVFLEIQVVSKCFYPCSWQAEHIHLFSEECALILGGCLSNDKLKGEEKK